MKKLDIRGKTVLLDDDTYERFKDLSWYVTRQDYVMNSKYRIPMHRMIIDCPENMVVDHINGNALDNRRENLRICTQSQNLMNKRKQKGSFTSRYKGVHWDKQKNKWRAVIYKEGKRKHLGYFEEERDAAEAYNKASEEVFGEFARPNVIDEIA